MKNKRIWGPLFAAAVCIALLAALCAGALADDFLTYYDPTDDLYHSKRCLQYFELTSDSDMTLSGDGTWYAVTGSVRVNKVTVYVSGSVNLLLADGSRFAAEYFLVDKDSSLTIWSQTLGDNMGQLYTGGIGGGERGDCGTITINGGSIETTGIENRAGIGGGSRGGGGTITVNGGRIKAAGGKYAAGIGGGYYGGGGAVTINGGSITAQGGGYGAGTGGGDHGDGGSITVNGGSITSNGGRYAAGIGGGNCGSGGYVSISGGVVTAAGGSEGAGIGGGDEAPNNSGIVTVTGGSVTAKGGDWAAGIGGGGVHGSNPGDSSVSGSGGNGGTVYISGGEVRAESGAKAAGIGGGNHGNGGAVTVTGGTVTAVGFDQWGAGIGGGNCGNGGNVTVSGGTVEARAGTGKTQAIGAGDGASRSGSLDIKPGICVYAADASPGVRAKTDARADACRSGKWAKLLPCEDHEFDQGLQCVYCGGHMYLDPTDPSEPVKCVNLHTDYEGQTELTGGWYVVTGSFEVSKRITVSGNVDLLLCDGARLNAQNGINVAGDNSLTVWAQSDAEAEGSVAGILKAEPDHYKSGIGSYNESKSGNITLNGGNITATGGQYAAGIGGGGGEGGGGSGRIAINGGVVNATGGVTGAGIGGGGSGDGGEITITGGAVTAYGGFQAAGIGGGSRGGAGVIVITGGAVTAYGGEGYGSGSSGIGCGCAGSCGEITVSGGKVIARGSGGEALGRGSTPENQVSLSIPGMRVGTVGNGGEVVWTSAARRKEVCRSTGGITVCLQLCGTDECPHEYTNGICVCSALGGGKIKYLDPTQEDPHQEREGFTVLTDQAELTTGWYAVSGDAEISARITVNGDVHLILCDGSEFKAKEGINVSSGNSLTIYAQSDATAEGSLAGALTATGHYNNAGIGGGESQPGGAITINGGVITASCSSGGEHSANGAGIGGGEEGGGGTITVNGGVITASCSPGGEQSANGAGMGGGKEGGGGTITVNGGVITASCRSESYSQGAGIGGGFKGSGGTVTINGGTVEAVCLSSVYSCGAGIGGGFEGSGGTVTITGGDVSARCSGFSAQGAGIGGGRGGSVDAVTVNGGAVTASCSDNEYSNGPAVGLAGEIKLGDTRAFGSPDQGAQPAQAAGRAAACGGKWVKLTLCDPHLMADGYCVYCSHAGAQAEITKAPAAKKLTYNGESQTLVAAGAAKDGTVVYALGTADAAPGDGDFKEELPAGKDAGTYYVWYRAEGGDEHTDGGILGPVRVTLSPAPATITALDAWKYAGEEDPDFKAMIEGAVKNEHLNYSIECKSGGAVGTYKLTVIPGKNPNYTVKTVDGLFTIKDGSARLTAVQTSGGKMVTAAVTKGAADVEGARLIAAWYDSSGRLLGCAVKTVIDAGETAEFELKRPGGADGAAVCRVYLIGAGDSKPLCPAAEVKATGNK